jgi:orotate phosphoribosyltransferase
MAEADVLRTLAAMGAIITDSHVVYTSGQHGRDYVNKDAMYLHPQVTERVCARMAQEYDPAQVDVVAGPTVGGVILAQWVAWHLSQVREQGEVLAVYAEEEGAVRRRIFKRGYEQQIPGKRVVVVEDVVNTGGSARKVVDAVRDLGGEVAGVSILCNRSGDPHIDLGAPLHALVTLDLESWPAAACPLCQQGVPINTAVGKGKQFLAHQGAH